MQLVYLVYLVLKLSPVPVPVCPLALVCGRVPECDSVVIASTGYAGAVWAPCDGHDPAFPMSQHTKELREGKKIKLSFIVADKARARGNIYKGVSVW